MQFSIFSILAIATVAIAAPQSACENGGLFYSDPKTLEPCKSACAGGTCAFQGTCETDPNIPLLCLAKCTC
ncbi:uncharacterized protein FFB20_11396 [Fusarium fujikuroi]|uniref:Invertebrate defensins family profile domain-containing protein n=10 Tax=Fusarium TaxID=5506 RepID=W7MTA4_GIBM7|nr:hypothetical protein FVEG_17305 [Fusarium verticillioides 7600]XP_018760547.1 hypothetical protein FVEG_17305 [Fusarium verticillioides 7600]XP_018760548.1 hypothetical protein FVEG_17305 [Fusarium verticillioides 7600]XP_018760549.1 hypothetical protein FVEG_17305 [Fusarium verticillioides 7600]XP_018760550.1 hypothetical protein FVEG_17305 [Fusarium verticillioides 7600]XP_023427347.1 uncharacterized protein FFUJ_02199 [Fusarium fujikuroi IMI 58289]XP_031089245.1 uncharacterized protein 